MKLKNITGSVREIKNIGGLRSLVKPGEIIELSNPKLDKHTLKAFKIIKKVKSKKRNSKLVKKEDIIE